MAKMPAHWYGNSFLNRATARLLSPLGEMYGEQTIARWNKPPLWRAPIPVVCVGNATVGGSGKTPLTRALRRLLLDVFDRPAVIIRGYRGELERPIVIQNGIGSASLAGDEAMLHADDGLTVVTANRVLGARLALDQRADVIIMDDGLQNRDLYQDVRIMAVPMLTRFGNERCVPAGPLRAPIEQTMANCDMIVGVGPWTEREAILALGQRYQQPVFFGEPRLTGLAHDLFERPAVAYAGTAFPERFFNDLQDAGINVVYAAEIGNHDVPSDAICRDLIRMARKHDANLLTTEKDMARLKGRGGNAGDLFVFSRAVGYTIGLDEPLQLLEAIEAKIYASRERDEQLLHLDMPPDAPLTNSEDRLGR